MNTKLTFIHYLKRYASGIALASIFITVYFLASYIQSPLNIFFDFYAVPLLITLLLVSIYQIHSSNKRKVDSLFWSLLFFAFTSWFVLTITKFLFYESLSRNTFFLVESISNFLFYSLTISAIEMKSYSKASNVLDNRSLLSSLSIFTFILGAFSFLVLAREYDNQREQSIFYFYLLMDCYLVLRWLHLSWQSREFSAYCSGYLVLGLASFCWLFSDLIEASILLENSMLTALPSFSTFILDIFYLGERHSSLNEITYHQHWIWYLPFFLFYFGIKLLNQADLTKENKHLLNNPKLGRYSLLNSPLFFLVIIALTLSFNDFFFITESSPTLINVQAIWIIVTLLLALVQVVQLFKDSNNKKRAIIKYEQLFNDQRTEMISLRSQLNKQKYFNQTLLDTINNPIFTLNLSGKILTVNRAACTLLNYKEEKLVGAYFTDFIPNTEELSFFFQYQSYRHKLAKNKKGLELESKVLTSNKLLIDVHITISKGSFFNSENIIVSLADIRKQKALENSLHQLKDDITANISHEFRTPLTIINGVLVELISHNQNQYSNEKLEVAKRNNLRLTHMVDQLLDFSKSSSQTLPIVDLNASVWLPLVCKSYESIASEKAINYKITLEKNIYIKGNQQALENIINNLLSNAFKYTKHNGNIDISLKSMDDEYRLDVSDTGIGIAKSEQAYIFDRFHRVNENKLNKPGVGLGLSLVKNLVSSMGWRIEFSSTEHLGSIFTVFITKSSLPSPSSDSKSAMKNDHAEQHNGRFKNKAINLELNSVNHLVNKKSQNLILIIEDNLDMQQYLQSIVSPYHQCLVANDGQQGLKMSEEILPDIIISDVMMPNMDGFEVLKKIKTMDSTAHIPIILLTAMNDKKSRVRGLLGKADDYISKPFDADELVIKISNILNARKKLQQKFEAQWHGFAQKQPNSTAIVENEFLNQLNQLFEHYYGDAAFTMNQLAKLMAMSERQLQRKVKALVNVSPLELLKRFRLEKAKVALMNDIQIGLVAQNCGFSSQTYFGRCFKLQFGMTPKAFQKQL